MSGGWEHNRLPATARSPRLRRPVGRAHLHRTQREAAVVLPPPTIPSPFGNFEPERTHPFRQSAPPRQMLQPWHPLARLRTERDALPCGPPGAVRFSGALTRPETGCGHPPVMRTATALRRLTSATTQRSPVPPAPSAPPIFAGCVSRSSAVTGHARFATSTLFSSSMAMRSITVTPLKRSATHSHTRWWSVEPHVSDGPSTTGHPVTSQARPIRSSTSSPISRTSTLSGSTP